MKQNRLTIKEKIAEISFQKSFYDRFCKNVLLNTAKMESIYDLGDDVYFAVDIPLREIVINQLINEFYEKRN